MGCRWCVHWKSEENRYLDKLNQPGECRRYPQPVKTKSEYRCGEFVVEPDHWEREGSNMMQTFYMSMREYRKSSDEQRTKRIALEKVNKELRRKLKSKVP